MRSDILRWFLDFFVANCSLNLNGKISTVDNPGFSVKICFGETGLENKQFNQVNIERSEHDWLHCFIRDTNFEAFCGPTNLSEVLRFFYDWIQNNQSNSQSRETSLEDNQNLQWLEIWYARQCDDDWEHENGIEIHFLSDFTCYLSIDLIGTEFEDKEFTNVTHKRSHIDWLECVVKNNKFNGVCCPTNLIEVLSIFQNWIEKYQKNFSEYFAHSEFFKQKSLFQIGEEISVVLLKFNKIIDVVVGKIILNIIPFYDHIHFVFEGEVSLDAYTKSVGSKTLLALKGLRILHGETRCHIIHLQLEDNQFIDLDLECVFEGSYVRLELHAPEKHVGSRSDWTPPTAGNKTWTLFL